MEPVSIYLHIPFCQKRCSYCDFHTFAGQEHLRPAYVAALRREIGQAAALAPARLPVHTVFFGGGTPSLLPPAEVSSLLEAIRDGYDLATDAEISMEANPGTVTAESLAGYRAAGVNRLSFGMQSANADELRLLERLHDTPDVLRAAGEARAVGFDNLNLDLMLGLPNQNLAAWQTSLETALALRPEHLSLYILTIESGTPLAHWVRDGRVREPDADQAADLYEWTEERLAHSGYAHYEISNWALPGRQARHNLQYWRSLPYLGFGAAAHGYIAGQRTENTGGILAYIQAMLAPSAGPFPRTAATHQLTPIDAHTAQQEYMMVGLRLTEEGVSPSGFTGRFGQRLEERFGQEIRRCLDWGLLEWGGDAKTSLRLTPRGRLLGNLVFQQFVGD